MTDPMNQSASEEMPQAAIEAAADELVAHGEFSRIPSNNYTSALMAAKAALTAALPHLFPAPADSGAVAWTCVDFCYDPCGSARCQNCGKRRHEHPVARPSPGLQKVIDGTNARIREAFSSASPSTGRVTVEYDGFVGTVIGSYVTREGKRGVVVQQDGTRVVHVYGEARVKPASSPLDPPDHGGGEGETRAGIVEECAKAAVFAIRDAVAMVPRGPFMDEQLPSRPALCQIVRDAIRSRASIPQESKDGR